MECCRTNPRLTTRIEDLAAALRRQAKGGLCAEAAAELLIGHRSWLVRDVFVTRFVEMVPGLAGDETMALIDWEAAVAAVSAGCLGCSASEAQMLGLAASLAVGVPVDLSLALTGLDDDNVALVVAALRRAGGDETAGAGVPGTRGLEATSSGAAAPRSPSRNDGVTMPCPVCGALVTPAGRRRYCSDACRQAGHRRRHGGPSVTPELPPRRPRRPVTVYTCPSCDTRQIGEQYCFDCATFMCKVGVGGCCPACDEPVAYEELTHG